MRFSRRQMVLGMLGIGASISLPNNLMAQKRQPNQPGSITDQRTLQAALERILPGATEAGIVVYFNSLLAQEPFRQYIANLIRIGLLHLNRQAQSTYNKAFANCKEEQQDALLTRFQKGQFKAKRFNSKLFFEHLVQFCLEGFLGDPKYGGNRHEIGWRFIGRVKCWWQPRHLDLILKPNEGLPF